MIFINPLKSMYLELESDQIPFNISREPFKPGEHVPYRAVIDPVRRVQIITSWR